MSDFLKKLKQAAESGDEKKASDFIKRINDIDKLASLPKDHSNRNIIKEEYRNKTNHYDPTKELSEEEVEENKKVLEERMEKQRKEDIINRAKETLENMKISLSKLKEERDEFIKKVDKDIETGENNIKTKENEVIELEKKLLGNKKE